MIGHSGVTEVRINIVRQIANCSMEKATKTLLALQETEIENPDTAGDKQYDTSTQTASTLCGVCKHTFLKYAENYPDELPYVKLGCAFKFSRNDVEAFIRRRIHGAG